MRKLLFVVLLFAAPAYAADSPDDKGYCVISANESVASTRAECPADRGIFIQPQLRPLGAIPKK